MPTDKRFINLEDEQKIFIFNGVNRLPSNEIIKEGTVYTNKKDEIENKKPIEYIGKTIKDNMIKTLKIQNFTDEEIEKKLIEFGENIKQAKLNELEKQFRRSNNG